MLLTALAENIRDRLNNNKSEWAPEFKQVKAELCIDWVSSVGKPGFKVLIVPELNQYLADDTNSREWIKSLQSTKYLSLIIGYTFAEQTGNDTAATWAEASFILDVREKIELFLLRQSYADIKLLITDIECQPISDLELDRRMFNAITSIGFNDQPCSTEQESSSLSSLSNDNTMSAERRASMRRAVLSEQRLGRR